MAINLFCPSLNLVLSCCWLWHFNTFFGKFWQWEITLKMRLKLSKKQFWNIYSCRIYIWNFYCVSGFFICSMLVSISCCSLGPNILEKQFVCNGRISRSEAVPYCRYLMLFDHFTRYLYSSMIKFLKKKIKYTVYSSLMTHLYVFMQYCTFKISLIWI